MQYTSPVANGLSSPHTAAALASSWRASPASTSPLMTSARAFPDRAIICTSRSAIRWPRAKASSKSSSDFG